MQLIDIAQEEIEPVQIKGNFIDIPSKDIDYGDNFAESPLAKAGRIAGETVNVLKEYVSPAIPVVKEGVDIANAIAKKYLTGGRLPTMMTEKPGGFITPVPQPEAPPPQDVAIPGPVMPAPEKVERPLERAARQLTGMPTETIPSHEPVKSRKFALESEVSKLGEFKKQIDTEEKGYTQEVEQINSLRKQLDSMKVDNTSEESVSNFNKMVKKHNSILEKIKQHPFHSHVSEFNEQVKKTQGNIDLFNKDMRIKQGQIDIGLETSHLPIQERTELVRLAEESKAKAPTISTLTRKPEMGFIERLVPRFMKPETGITPADIAKSQNIIQIAKVTNLPLNFIEQNYEKVARETARKAGVYTEPTSQEMVQGLMYAAIGAGMLTHPIGTLVGVGTYMGIKEAESVGVQLAKKEKPKVLASREVKEFLGPLREPYSSMVDTLEFLVPGGLSAKIGVKVKTKLSQKLSEKLIQEAWDEAILKRAEAEKGRLLAYKPKIEGRPVEAPPGPELVSPIKPIQPKAKPIEPTRPIKPIIKAQEVPLEMVPIELTEVVPEVKAVEKPKFEAPKPPPEPQISRETAKYLELDQEFIDLRNRAIKGEILSDADLKRYEDLRIEVPYWMEKAGISAEEAEIPPTRPLPEEKVSKEAMPVTEGKGKKAITTSEEAQTAVDNKIDELMKKGMSFEDASNNPETEALFKIRDEIDRKDLTDWRKTIIKDSGLNPTEAEQALDALGFTKDQTSGVYFTAKNLRHWGTETESNLKQLYNHFTQNDKERSFAKFRWGGTADNITLQGSVFDEDLRPSKWNETALKKTEAVFNAIAKTQSLDIIDLSRIPGGLPRRQPTKAISAAPPRVETVTAPIEERPAPKTFDLLNWVRSKGRIREDTKSADVVSLTPRESGFTGKNALTTREPSGRGLDELAQEFEWETGRPITTDELTQAIKDTVESKKKGVPRGLGLGATDEDIARFTKKMDREYERVEILAADEKLAEPQTFKNLTKSFKDEIIIFREEAIRNGYTETYTDWAIERLEHALRMIKYLQVLKDSGKYFQKKSPQEPQKSQNLPKS